MLTVIQLCSMKQKHTDKHQYIYALLTEATTLPTWVVLAKLSLTSSPAENQNGLKPV